MVMAYGIWNAKGASSVDADCRAQQTDLFSVVVWFGHNLLKLDSVGSCLILIEYGVWNIHLSLVLYFQLLSNSGVGGRVRFQEMECSVLF